MRSTLSRARVQFDMFNKGHVPDIVEIDAIDTLYETKTSLSREPCLSVHGFLLLDFPSIFMYFHVLHMRLSAVCVHTHSVLCIHTLYSHTVFTHCIHIL